MEATARSSEAVPFHPGDTLAYRWRKFVFGRLPPGAFC